MTRPPLKLIGERATKDNVKTVSQRLVCFVGRLHKDTTEDHLANYLAEAGIQDVKCTLIKPKEGCTFNTAAFRVSCDPQYAAIFYNEESWPDGAKLRDWGILLSFLYLLSPWHLLHLQLVCLTYKALEMVSTVCPICVRLVTWLQLKSIPAGRCFRTSPSYTEFNRNSMWLIP